MGLPDKLIAGAVVLALLGGLGWLFNHQIKARVDAEGRATKYELARDLAEAERDELRADIEAERLRTATLTDELQLAREIEAEATAVLADRGRFENLLQQKPGLLEIKARKATTQVWATIEAEANAQ